ncbi:toprim domain-containing protein [Roseovarius sp. SYSU LYC5161]|uniref:DUF7146 domain-containing protein n=1 Tax=Roseovarius halophilus (ex Wu et al. 2025) TaxID=3376060 RepID=UPI00399983B0
MDSTTLTRDLGGKWLGRYGCAPCPCCQPERRKEQNALTLADGRDGRLLLHCKKTGCDFADILAAAGVAPGSYTPPDPAIIAQRDREERAQAEKRARQAERCWQEALPIAGTIAERYLRARGITCDLPGTLRFHPECWHGPTAKRHPALIALIEGADGCAVHRTYLRPDGTGKASLDGGNKLMLGSTAGGAVRLTQAQGRLAVAEGIETALSLASGLLGHPATIWAALSTSGMRGLRLPPSPGRLTVATDGDPAGAAAGRDLAERAHALGWAVSMLPAPRGKDWCDVLAGKAVMA